MDVILFPVEYIIAPIVERTVYLAPNVVIVLITKGINQTNVSQITADVNDVFQTRITSDSTSTIEF